MQADRSTDQLADRAVWDNSPNPSGERLDQPVSGGYGQGGWTARDLTVRAAVRGEARARTRLTLVRRRTRRDYLGLQPAERLEQARANAAGKREEQDYMTQTE